MRIKVYWNSHKKLFSCLYKGKVVFRSGTVVLDNVDFKVNENGRAKVLRTKVKSVHAFVCGNMSYNNNIKLESYKKEFRYDPYKGDSFFDKNTNKKLNKASSVYLTSENGKPFCFYIE